MTLKWHISSSASPMKFRNKLRAVIEDAPDISRHVRLSAVDGVVRPDACVLSCESPSTGRASMFLAILSRYSALEALTLRRHVLTNVLVGALGCFPAPAHCAHCASLTHGEIGNCLAAWMWFSYVRARRHLPSSSSRYAALSFPSPVWNFRRLLMSALCGSEARGAAPLCACRCAGRRAYTRCCWRASTAWTR